MKLTDLNPSWMSYGGEGVSDKDGNPIPEREKVGIVFDCPCGKCDMPCFVSFANPPDGKGPYDPARPGWQRTGDTFETLTLTPSILRTPGKGGCGWHGYVTNGEIKTC